MFEIAATIAEILTSLKTGGDILKTIAGLRDTKAIRAEVDNLREVQFRVSSGVATIHQEYLAMAESNRVMREELEQRGRWAVEKQRYELYRFAAGIYVWAIKPAAQGADPFHALCAQCFEQDRKSILQVRDRPFGMASAICLACKSELDFDTPQSPFHLPDDER
jgi:hypothetical protein